VNGLLYGADEAVATWAFQRFNLTPFRYDMAIGIVNPSVGIVGAAFFYWWTGPNVYFGYYGPKTMRLGLMRSLAQTAIDQFDASRVTIRTKKTNKRFIKGLIKVGAQYEATCHRFYGKEDISENIAVQYVLFRAALENFVTRKVKERIDG
jgi:RimJ/RimL family protein N-acetyltransferase